MKIKIRILNHYKQTWIHLASIKICFEKKKRKFLKILQQISFFQKFFQNFLINVEKYERFIFLFL